MANLSKNTDNEIPTINYIRIINWFWDEVPYYSNFKPYHVSLFFAVLDSINRNRWQQTRIAYEYLITKCGLAKRSYLESRDWLVANKLIEVIPGKNSYQMASFSLGIAVQFCTAIDTAISTSTAPLLTPLRAPNNKQINNKHLNKDIIERQNIFFDEVMSFKKTYDEGMLQQFFGYWTEKNTDKTKMRFETEKFFETAKRLSTWARRSNKLLNNKSNYNGNTAKEPAKEFGDWGGK
ncbi:hypothetical protein [Parafilimonas terrae]|uniref:Uncharacterized protein n=1 Tax=Parafilimonas terrae TaxID=1465490 RepID=A0A1I5UAU6_9BACT|nr:hypothetical protein [Parafilimonas terrae]SFP92332.1 hypothetical protein SAMN05444277_103173 [Parafilimonas terrae]